MGVGPPNDFWKHLLYFPVSIPVSDYPTLRLALPPSPRLTKKAMVFSATALFLLDATSSVAQAPSPITQFAPLIFIGVIFYFLLIRPQQKQRKEQQKLISALKTGDKIVTSSGIYGLISNVKETTVLLKVADNVKIEIDKASVATVLQSSPDSSVENPAA